MVSARLPRPRNTGPAVGTRVIVDPVTYCGACHQCRAGQYNIYPSGAPIGRERHRGFADFASAPIGNVYALPDEMKNKEASFLQVLTMCVHAQQLGPVMLGESVVVIRLEGHGTASSSIGRILQLIATTLRAGWKTWRDLGNTG